MSKILITGYCRCGCGEKTPIATRNRKERDQVKGEPLKYINHHHPAWNKGISVYLGGKRFEKGQTPWNKGKKGLQKAWNKGIKTPEEIKNKLRGSRENTRGENNHNWKGGTYGTERHRDMSRAEYVYWRKAVFERDNYTCQECGNRGGELNADHIKPWAFYPKLRHKISNGRTLCIHCHKKTDTWGGRVQKYE